MLHFSFHVGGTKSTDIIHICVDTLFCCGMVMILTLL
jgi:hypothetical protein